MSRISKTIRQTIDLVKILTISIDSSYPYTISFKLHWPEWACFLFRKWRVIEGPPLLKRCVLHYAKSEQRYVPYTKSRSKNYPGWPLSTARQMSKQLHTVRRGGISGRGAHGWFSWKEGKTGSAQWPGGCQECDWTGWDIWWISLLLFLFTLDQLG